MLTKKPIMETANKGPTKGQQRATNNNDKNEKKNTWLTPFNEIWKQHFGVDMAFGKAGMSLKTIVKQYPVDDICRGLDYYLDKTEARFANLPNFAEKAGLYIAQSRSGR